MSGGKNCRIHWFRTQQLINNLKSETILSECWRYDPKSRCVWQATCWETVSPRCNNLRRVWGTTAVSVRRMLRCPETLVQRVCPTSVCAAANVEPFQSFCCSGSTATVLRRQCRPLRHPLTHCCINNYLYICFHRTTLRSVFDHLIKHTHTTFSELLVSQKYVALPVGWRWNSCRDHPCWER